MIVEYKHVDDFNDPDASLIAAAPDLLGEAQVLRCLASSPRFQAMTVADALAELAANGCGHDGGAAIAKAKGGRADRGGIMFAASSLLPADSRADYHVIDNADARLISASPDLLAACEAVYAAFGLKDTLPLGFPPALERLLKDAIAKATGGAA